MIIGVTGYAQSGKDTVGSYLTSVGYTRLAFADALRDAVYDLNPIVSEEDGSRLQDWVDALGWDVAKVQIPEVRRLLQVMGTEVGRMLFGQNVWIDIVDRKAQDELDVVVTDVRFQNEVDYIHSRGGRVVRVDRPGVGAVNTHVSDQLDFVPDYVVENDGSLEDLFLKVGELLNSIV